MMNLDRFLAVLGIFISLMGMLFTLKAFSVGWVILLIGFILVFFAVWRIYIAPPITPISRSNHYEFKDPNGDLVEVTRTAVYRINARNVTTIWARRIQSTGDLKNFASNIGTIRLDEASGGGHTVRLELDRPPKHGKTVTWILKFEGHHCFDKKHESVSSETRQKWKNGAMSIAFHQIRFPATVRKVHFSRGEERILEEVSLDPVAPFINWQFRPKLGEDYLLQWTWPDATV